MSSKPSSAVIEKTVDARGRLTLGKRFARRNIVIEPMGEHEMRVRFTDAPPAADWLSRNEAARASVLRGVQQARDRRFAESPDVVADIERIERKKDARS